MDQLSGPRFSGLKTDLMQFWKLNPAGMDKSVLKKASPVRTPVGHLWAPPSGRVLTMNKR